VGDRGEGLSRKPSPTSTSSSTGPYVDANHIALRAVGGDCRSGRGGPRPDFPILGTGKYDWQGYEPKTHDAEWLPFDKHPQAVDPDFLVSWNNKQAPEWAAADDKYDYGPIFRQQMIADHIRHDIKGNKKIDDRPAGPGDGGNRRPEDLRADKVLPLVGEGDRHAEVGAAEERSGRV